ncbi:MAG TPA: plasmid replication protein, CyRepA1 family [Vampirovibrionales bacterium]
MLAQNSNLNNFIRKDWAGIAPELIAANVKPLEGMAALDFLLYSDRLPRTQSGGCIIRRDILRKYVHVEQGGWGCAGLDPAYCWETEGLWGTFKPIAPRINADGKLIKYEHPPKEEGGVFYLKVPRSVWKRIADRAGVSMGQWDNFWRWVKAHPEIAIFITEGVKKAAALLSAGYVAIALPGVNMYARDKQLKAELAAIGFEDRQVVIAYDYDTKPQTQQNVQWAAIKLSNLIKRAGGQVEFLRMPPPADGEKMGIDDYIRTTGDVDLAGCTRSSWSMYPRDEWVLSNPTVEVNRRYLGDIELPDSGLALIKSGTGTGKTDSIAKQVSRWTGAGRRVLVITNRITTGRELAARFGVGYVDDRKKEAAALGLAICIESCSPFGKGGIRATRVKEDGELLESEWLDDPVIILDEFDQTLSQALGGATCQKERGWILSTFKALIQDVLCQSNGLVVAMSADLSDVDAEFLTAIAAEGGKEIKPWTLVNIHKHGHKYDAFLHSSKESVYLRCLEVLAAKPADTTVFFSIEGQASRTKWGTQTLEKMLAKDRPEVRLLRIDSETLADPNHPACGCIENLNEVARGYDILLVSTSISSAVSLKEPRWAGVFDISAGLVGTRELRQRLDRVRQPVDRHLFIPKAAKPIGNGSSYYKEVSAGKMRSVKVLMSILKDIDFDVEANHDAICFRTWAKQVARHNSDAYHYQDAAIELLKSEGVIFEDPEDFDADTRMLIREAITETKEIQWDAHCADRVAAEEYSPEDFEAVDGKTKKTRAERLACDRYRIKHEFGDVTENLAKKWDQGKRSQWRLHFHLLFAHYAENSDRRSLEAIQKKPMIHLPDVRVYSARRKMLEMLGILDLIDTQDEEWFNDHPKIQEIAASAIANRTDIKNVLGIHIPDQPIPIIQALLGLLDLKLTRTRRGRVEGKVKHFYSFTPPDDERWAVFGHWAEIEEVIQNSHKEYIEENSGSPQEVDHPPALPVSPARVIEPGDKIAVPSDGGITVAEVLRVSAEGGVVVLQRIRLGRHIFTPIAEFTVEQIKKAAARLEDLWAAVYKMVGLGLEIAVPGEDAGEAELLKALAEVF